MTTISVETQVYFKRQHTRLFISDILTHMWKTRASPNHFTKRGDLGPQNLPFFIEVPVPSYEKVHLCICVIVVLILPQSLQFVDGILELFRQCGMSPIFYGTFVLP